MITADLTPARWIWLPSDRTLPNTVVLFRRSVVLDAVPDTAAGRITADSRYRLSVNGARVQWGPAPSDPRWPDVDPVDLAPYLRVGENVIGVEVLYYGHGDGTWVLGKPGLLAEFGFGAQTIVTDDAWLSTVDRGYQPGHYQRWFLRALQEDFDATRHPTGWNLPGFEPGPEWLPAMDLDVPADRPSLVGGYPDWLNDSIPDAGIDAHLRPRELAPVLERFVAAGTPVEAHRIMWTREPDDWFQLRIPGSFTTAPIPPTEMLDSGDAATWALDRQIVGFPSFTIDAPAGTVVELLWQEGHQRGVPWLDSNRAHWLRYTCTEGRNEFTSFEFESLRWLQLHVRGNARPVHVERIGVLQRTFPFEREPEFAVSDPALHRLMEAAAQTIRNNSIETIVDGHGRERQQYSGDLHPVFHALRSAFGERTMPARFLRSFSEGLTTAGWFMDTWPARDRMVRIPQRELGLTPWGPMLDHGVQFVFDNFDHWWATGDRAALEESYPRLRVFAEYLRTLVTDDALMRVEHLGVPTVWLDFEAYERQSQKQAAFTLYVSAMLDRALAPLAELFGDDPAPYRALAGHLLAGARERFFDGELFRDDDDGTLSDRTLAMSVLFEQAPVGPAVEAIANRRAAFSYPANADWRFRALARGGRMDAVLSELRDWWANSPSVIENGTIAEHYDSPPDSRAQWSHCAVGPLNVLYEGVAGIRATEPGFSAVALEPQVADIGNVSLQFRTVRGPIAFVSNGEGIRYELPRGMLWTTSRVPVTVVLR